MNFRLKALCLMSTFLCCASTSAMQMYNQYQQVRNPPRFQLVPPARPLRMSSFPRPSVFPGYNQAQLGHGLPATPFHQQQQPLVQPFPPITAADELMLPVPEPFRESFNPDINPFEPRPLLISASTSTKLVQNNSGSPSRPALLPFLRPLGFPNKLPSVPISANPTEGSTYVQISTMISTSSVSSTTSSDALPDVTQPPSPSITASMLATTTMFPPTSSETLQPSTVDASSPVDEVTGISTTVAQEAAGLPTDAQTDVNESSTVAPQKRSAMENLPSHSLTLNTTSPNPIDPFPTTVTNSSIYNSNATVSKAGKFLFLDIAEVPDLVEFPETFNISGMENVSTNFSCEGRSYGYYADVETDCLVFHHCIPLPDRMIRASFRCPADTVFNQIHRVCTQLPLSIPCQDAPKFYSVNAEFTMLPDSQVPPSSLELLAPLPFFACPAQYPGSYRNPTATSCNTYVRCREAQVDGQIFLVGEVMKCVDGQIFHEGLGQCISMPVNFSCVLY